MRSFSISHLLGLAIVALGLAACASSPKWLTEANSDTQSQFITVGSGTNKESALQDALANLANRLIVNVQAQTITNNQKRADGEVLQTFDMTGTSRSEHFSFINPTVLNTTTHNGATYVQAAVDKARFFKQINAIVDKKLTTALDYEFDNKVSIISRGLQIWPELPKIEAYLNLLAMYQPVGKIKQAKLDNLKRDFLAAIADTKMKVVVSQNDNIRQLGIGQSLTQRINSMGFSEQANDELTLVVVGPTVQSYRAEPFTATKLAGQSVLFFNGQKVMTKPITVTKYERSAAMSLASAKASFIDALFTEDL